MCYNYAESAIQNERTYLSTSQQDVHILKMADWYKKMFVAVWVTTVKCKTDSAVVYMSRDEFRATVSYQYIHL